MPAFPKQAQFFPAWLLLLIMSVFVELTLILLSNLNVILANYTLYGFHAAPGIYPETNYLLEINGLNWAKNKIADLNDYDADGDIHGNPFIYYPRNNQIITTIGGNINNMSLFEFNIDKNTTTLLTNSSFVSLLDLQECNCCMLNNTNIFIGITQNLQTNTIQIIKIDVSTGEIIETMITKNIDQYTINLSLFVLNNKDCQYITIRNNIHLNNLSLFMFDLLNHTNFKIYNDTASQQILSQIAAIWYDNGIDKFRILKQTKPIYQLVGMASITLLSDNGMNNSIIMNNSCDLKNAMELYGDSWDIYTYSKDNKYLFYIGNYQGGEQVALTIDINKCMVVHEQLDFDTDLLTLTCA